MYKTTTGTVTSYARSSATALSRTSDVITLRPVPTAAAARSVRSLFFRRSPRSEAHGAADRTPCDPPPTPPGLSRCSPGRTAASEMEAAEEKPLSAAQRRAELRRRKLLNNSEDRMNRIVGFSKNESETNGEIVSCGISDRRFCGFYGLRVPTTTERVCGLEK